VVFADEQHHYFLGLLRNEQGPKLVLAVRNGANDPNEGRIIAAAAYKGVPGEPVRLRVSARGPAYDFAYAIGRGPWIQLLANADGRMLASELTNLFTGTMIGVYAARSAVSQ
jgi:xylan 1,4-beta-xylosidase